MATDHHLTIALDGERAAELARLAERTSVGEEVFAGELLSALLDSARTDTGELAELLDRIPGAFEAAERGRGEGRGGQTVPLAEL